MPTDSPEVPGPHKHKLSTKAAINGDPEVQWKKKKLEAKKQSTKLAPTQKPHNPQHIPVEATDESDDEVNTPAPPRKSTTSTKKPIIMKRRPSIEVEETEDESDNYHTSVPPSNPRHILEAADGSDNAIEEDPAPGGSEEGEAPEESDESELGTQLYYRMRH